MGQNRRAIIGNTVLPYDTLESTNALGKKMAWDGAREGTVIRARIQTKGRGRKERAWHSPPGGLWFSVILRPDLEPDSAMLATMAASVSIHRAVKDICHLDTIIKWPNDVLLNDKKVAGVLTELHGEKGRIEYMVMGIGINVNNDLPEDLESTATSLRNAGGEEVDLEVLFHHLLATMDQIYSLIKEDRHSEIRKMWLDSTNIVGKKVRLTETHPCREGLVTGIDQKGRLLLDFDGTQEVLISGDIEIL